MIIIIISSFFNLSRLLFKRFGEKVWKLIDDYDAPFNNDLMNSRNKFRVVKSIKLFESLFERLFINNEYLEKGVLTGIRFLTQNSVLSRLNNVVKYNIDDYRYSQYFGWNEEEVQKFLKHFNIRDSNLTSKIKIWYGGYNIIKDYESRII